MLKKFIEKMIVRKIPEKFDSDLVKEVLAVWDKHGDELNDFWRRTEPKQRDELVIAFRKELEREWPVEFKETQLERVFDSTRENLITGIEGAYAAGYMISRNWISEKHLADFNLCLGDKFASRISSTLKGAKSKGIAFASAFSCVSAMGQLLAMKNRGIL